MVNPSEKFIKRISFLKNEKQCPSEWLKVLINVLKIYVTI
jgi:hypothetical protein